MMIDWQTWGGCAPTLVLVLTSFVQYWPVLYCRVNCIPIWSLASLKIAYLTVSLNVAAQADCPVVVTSEWSAFASSKVSASVKWHNCEHLTLHLTMSRICRLGTQVQIDIIGWVCESASRNFVFSFFSMVKNTDSWIAFANRKNWMNLQICLIEYCICKLELHMQIKITGWVCKFASLNVAFANPKLHLQIAYSKHCISNIESYLQVGNTSANRHHRMGLRVRLTQFCFFFFFDGKKYR